LGPEASAWKTETNVIGGYEIKEKKKRESAVNPALWYKSYVLRQRFSKTWPEGGNGKFQSKKPKKREESATEDKGKYLTGKKKTRTITILMSY